MQELSLKCIECGLDFYNLSDEIDYKNIELTEMCLECWKKQFNCKECMDCGYLDDNETGVTTNCECMQQENPADYIDNKL